MTTTKPQSFAEMHAFAQQHKLYFKRHPKWTVMIVPNGACNPLWRDAWTAIKNDGNSPDSWSGGQLVVWHNASDRLANLLA